MQLQESSRETRTENLELRQELTRLRYETREREKYWRSLLPSRKNAPITTTEIEEPPPPQLSSPFAAAPSSHSSVIQPHFSSNGTFRTVDSNQFAQGASSFQHSSATVPFTAQENINHDPSALQNRGAKFNGYTFPVHESPRANRWPVLSSGLATADPMTPHVQSPYVESPALTASTDMASYGSRFPTHDRKVSIENVLDNAPYIFPAGDRYNAVANGVPQSRSMSPNSTGSSTSLPLTSSFQYSFQDPSAGHDPSEFDYRRQPLQQCQEGILHNPPPDVSFQGHSGNYRLVRRPDDPQHSLLHGGSADQYEDDYSPRSRVVRRNAAHPYARSPSPGPAPISCTVAVIKAQAFGALRRTRTKPKKDSDGAAKVAINVLEARGIGPTPGVRGTHSLEDDMTTP